MLVGLVGVVLVGVVVAGVGIVVVEAPGSLVGLVDKIRGEIDLLTARLSPVSDGAAARLATVLRADLGRVSAVLDR